MLTVALLFAKRRGGTDVRAAFVHNASDALASVAVILGGAAILAFGWHWIDPLLSLAIVGYVAWQVAAMLPETVRVLMDEERAAVEAHPVIGREVAPRLDEITREARRRLRERFDVHHAALELEFPETAAEGGHGRSLIVDGCCEPDEPAPDAHEPAAHAHG